MEADALTRNFSAKKNHGYLNSLITQDNLLEKLHKGLGYPGITRLFHQVRIRNLPYSLADVTKVWESMLPTALHSIRSLLNTTTNCTPHERFFNYQRRPGSIGRKVLPSWLINPGPVLLKNFEKSNKNDDLVKRVDLLEANPHYAVIKDRRGNIKTVSTQYLAPFPRPNTLNNRTV